MRTWTVFLASFLCVSVVVFAFLARKPLCIDSKLVERFDRVGESSTASVYRCGLKKHVPYDGKFAHNVVKISDRLQNLEKFLDWIGPLKKRVNVTIIEDRAEVYKISGREIYMSEKIFNSTDQLEKAFLKVWFRENAHESLADQMLIEETMTDFLLWQMKGDITLRDPLTTVELNSAPDALWPRVLQTAVGYCQSPWRLTAHLDICSDLEKNKKDAKEISLYSIRPLMTQVMVRAYEGMYLTERMKMLRNFSNYLSQARFDGQFVGIEHEAATFLQNWLKTLKQENIKIEVAGTRPLKQWSYLLENQMVARGFSVEDKAAYIENLVWDESENEHIEKQIREQVQSLKVLGKPMNVGYIKGSKIWILPNQEGIALKVLKPIKSTKAILVRCGLPETKELVAYQEMTQRLLWVDGCDRKQQLNFGSYIRSGAENFARNNKETSFIEFHLPSLKMAVEKAPSLRLAQNFLNRASTAEMTSGMGWKSPKYVESVQAYRAQSAVEAIDWFRIKDPSRGL